MASSLVTSKRIGTTGRAVQCYAPGAAVAVDVCGSWGEFARLHGARTSAIHRLSLATQYTVLAHYFCLDSHSD